MAPTNEYRVSKNWKVIFLFLMVVEVIVFGGVAGVVISTGFPFDMNAHANSQFPLAFATSNGNNCNNFSEKGGRS
jgi:hypothetical protein